MTAEPPNYRSWQLPDVAEELAQQFHEIEACALRGMLGAMRELVDYSPWISPDLWAALEWPQKNEIAGDCPKRADWFDACVRRFKHALQPAALRVQVISRRKNRGAFVCALRGKATVDVRLDQVAAQRHWGVHFHAPSAENDQKLARACLETALARFHSDVASINKLCAEWPRDAAFLDTVSFSEDRRGNRFEQLVTGILNEEMLLAHPASLYKDVREWTDLRISRGGAVRVPVQIKFLSDPNFQEEMLANNRHLERVVMVSPVEIARFLEGSFDAETVGCDWTRFLRIFPRMPRNFVQLCREIYLLFVRAIERPPTHPLDPVHSVPLPLKNAVVALVGKRCAEFDRTGQDDAEPVAA